MTSQSASARKAAKIAYTYLSPREEAQMRKYILFTSLLLFLALYVGFIFAAQGSSSFEQEAVNADMKEAGSQYEAALVQYPQASPRVYALYGHKPELHEVFRKYGHNQIVPIIEKCFDEGDALLEWGTQFDGLMSSLLNKRLEVPAVAPADCGWRAILLTLVAGNNFLGQYVIDKEGKAHLLPGSSVLAIMKRLTTSGLQVIEKRLVLGESPTPEEWGLATLDVAVVGLAGKAVATAVKRGIARMARPTLGYKLTAARAGMMGFARTHAPRIAKYATIGGIAYLALYHPQVITGAAGVVADTLGVSPLLVQTLVWGIILFIPLWVVMTLLLFLRSAFRLPSLLFGSRLLRNPSHAARARHAA
jgi:hypothetical protein